MFDNFFDHNEAYTHSLPATAPLPPRDALREEARPEKLAGFHPVLNASRDGWVNVEDHRQHMDEKGNKVGGTPFWLPGDAHDALPRHMETLGPLPDGALLAAQETGASS